MICNQIHEKEWQAEDKITNVTEEYSKTLSYDKEKNPKYKKSYIVNSEFKGKIHVKLNIGREENRANNIKRNFNK